MQNPLPAVLVAVVCLPILLAAWWSLRRDLRHSDEGGWASRAELGGLRVRRPLPGRLTLGRAGGRLLAAEPRASVLLLGPSQSGKTTRLAVPALREWQGPVVATSVKQDLVDRTASGRPGPVFMFDPTSPRTHRWSPLDGCQVWGRALQMAGWIVAAAKPSRTNQDQFWYLSATKLLAPLMFALAHEGGAVADVAHTLDLREFRAVHETLERAGDPLPSAAFNAVLTRDDRQLSSVLGTLEQCLMVFADPSVANATSRSDFTPATVLRDQATLYLCGPLHEQTRLQPLYSALISAVVAEAYERYHHGRFPLTPPLLLLLDEVCNIAPIDQLPQILSTGGGVGVQVVAIAQDLAQLEHRYGEQAKTIVSNSRGRLLLGGLADMRSLELLSRLAGDTQVRRVSHTRDSSGRQSHQTAPERRRLLAEAAVRRLPPGEAVLLYGTYRPIRLRLRKEVFGDPVGVAEDAAAH